MRPLTYSLMITTVAAVEMYVTFLNLVPLEPVVQLDSFSPKLEVN